MTNDKTNAAPAPPPYHGKLHGETAEVNGRRWVWITAEDWLDAGPAMHSYESSVIATAEEIARLRQENAKLRQLYTTVPMQPIENDQGVVRFKRNRIVRYLLDVGDISLNHLAKCSYGFTQADWDQFYQLIGYSVSAYGDLSLVSRASVEEADKRVAALFPNEH
jgi:hypothetical protein